MSDDDHGHTDEARCDQCGMPPGKCVDDYGNTIGDCYDHGHAGILGGTVFDPRRGVVVSAPQPLTGDDLATIKAQVDDPRHITFAARVTIKRLVAEIERLRVVVESLYDAVDDYAALDDEALVAEVRRRGGYVIQCPPATAAPDGSPP
jgi:hypothetical protein